LHCGNEAEELIDAPWTLIKLKFRKA